MKFKNMKIEINEEQPLYAVIKELERLGYDRSEVNQVSHYVQTNAKRGVYKVMHKGFVFNHLPLTTLAELKEMK